MASKGRLKKKTINRFLELESVSEGFSSYVSIVKPTELVKTKRLNNSDILHIKLVC